ncbi:MAG: hypothetical protein IJ060_04255 [Oscillospiraceae bacterium]|nr:hypothetical protein [Oscillospiraceae bacterium]
MKIEMKPIAAAKKPRYAAALAVLASAAMLTGCGTAGETEEGTLVPGMNPGVSEDDLQIMGLEATYTEPAVTERQPELAGVAPIYTLPEDDPVALGGDVAIDDPVMLEGEAVPIDEPADPQEVLAPDPECSRDFAAANVQAWADRGAEIKLIAEAVRKRNDGTPAPQEACEDITVGGVPFTAYGMLPNGIGLFVRYNGQAESDGITEREWLEALTAAYETEQFSWGMTVLGTYNGNPCVIVFIDCSLYDSMTPDYAAAIAEDLFA